MVWLLAFNTQLNKYNSDLFLNFPKKSFIADFLKKKRKNDISKLKKIIVIVLAPCLL